MKHEERGNMIFIAFLNRLSSYFWPKDQETHSFRGIIPSILALGFFVLGIFWRSTAMQRISDSSNIFSSFY